MGGEAKDAENGILPPSKKDSCSGSRRAFHDDVQLLRTQLQAALGRWLASGATSREVAPVGAAGALTNGVAPEQPCGRSAMSKPQRTVMLVLMAAVCIDNYLLRAALGSAAVSIVSEFHFDLETKAALLSTFFWGYFCFNIPGGIMAARFGGAAVLGTAGLVWSLVALALPLAAEDGNVRNLCFCIFLLGAAEAPLLPASSAVLSTAAAPAERGRLIALRSASLRIGQLVSTLLTPLLCSEVDWRFVFRFYGLLGLLVSLLWLRCVQVEPAAELMPASVEMRTLSEDSDGKAPGSSESFGAFHLLRYSAVWALIATHASTNGAFYTLLSWGPTYFSEVLGVPFEAVGLPLMMPVVAMILGNLSSGAVMDRMLERGTPVLATRRKVLRTSLLTCGATLLMFAHIRSVPCATLLLCLACAALGVADTTVCSNYLDVAPLAAGSLMGVGNSFATLPGAIGPGAIALVLSSTGSWPLVFLALATCLMLAAFAFTSYGAAEDVHKRACEPWLRAIS